MQQKVIIITGASSGIGKALAYEYASKDFVVVLAARNIDKLQEIQSDLKANSKECLIVKTDVSIMSDCENLIEKTINKYQKIDVLINNAGISMRALFNDLELKVFKEVMDVNFWGTVYCTKFALPYLLESKGSLVGVVSIAAYLGMPARTAYGASKFAVRGFLDTLRAENLKNGLHVLVAAPGFTASNIRNSALTADGSIQGGSPRNEDEMMTSEEVAKRIYKSVKKRKAQLILTFVQGKLSVFLSKISPRFLDKMVYNALSKEPDSPLK